MPTIGAACPAALFEDVAADDDANELMECQAGSYLQPDGSGRGGA
jgi:hypothetical protein